MLNHFCKKPLWECTQALAAVAQGRQPADTVIAGARLVNVCTAEVQDDIDVAIAIEHLCLAAAEQGLGTCWVCNFRVQLCQELFKLPEEWYPAAIIPIGYPATPDIPEKTRKATAEIWEDR